MGARPLLRTATAEALLVLALGIAVLLRGDEVLPPAAIADRVAREPLVGQESQRTEPPAGPAERAAAVPAQLPLEPALPTESVDERDPLGLVLYGAVHDQDGNPLPHWAIYLTAANPDSKLSLRTSGDRCATWSLSGIPPGSYRVVCQSMGYQTIDEELTLLPAPRVQRRDFRLLRSLAIKVTFDMPEERRAALARDRHAVLASADELPERIPILDGGNIPFQPLGRWQQNARGELGVGCDGQILLQRAPPLYLNVFLGTVRLQSLYLAEMRDEVTFTIDEKSLREAVGSLRLRLIDASTGLPVVAAFVNLAMSGSSPPNEQGVLERSELEPGRQELLIWTENRYAAVSRAIEIRGGERLDLGDIRLEPSRALRGIVVDPSDKGVVAYVNATSLRDPNAPVMSPMLGAQSRADGRFDLAGLGEGRYLVRALTADRERMGLATAEAGTEADVRIVLLPTFPLQLLLHLGAYEECRATVRTVEGHGLHSERLMGPRPGRLRLPEGPYVLELSGAGRDRRLAFTVTQQGATVEVP